jgi:hypothetical protein
VVEGNFNLSQLQGCLEAVDRFKLSLAVFHAIEAQFSELAQLSFEWLQGCKPRYLEAY